MTPNARAAKKKEGRKDDGTVVGGLARIFLPSFRVLGRFAFAWELYGCIVVKLQMHRKTMQTGSHFSGCTHLNSAPLTLTGLGSFKRKTDHAPSGPSGTVNQLMNHFWTKQGRINQGAAVRTKFLFLYSFIPFECNARGKRCTFPTNLSRITLCLVGACHVGAQ